LVLVILSVIGFLPHQASTALIPGGFGVVLLVLGALGTQQKLRMHAMHAAVLVALVGLLGAVVMAVRAAVTGGWEERPLAFAMQVCMAVTCAVFVALCVKSFVDARRRRQQSGSQEAAREQTLA
jgi:zinc transporter ZupT